MLNLIHGLGDLGNGPALAYLFGGALLGLLIGVIPGLSTVVILSIILVFVNHINLTGTLCLFLGAQCGSFYAASVSAILLNTPGHAEAFPITFDGYPMARKGQPGRALGLSAGSTAIGGFIGCAVLVALLPIIDSLPGIFHPPEYLALVTLALLLVGTLGTNSVGKAVASAGFGLVLASIGPSSVGGVYRFTFGSISLLGGVLLVALALGIFAVPQMVMVYGTGTASARQSMTGEEIDAQMVDIQKGFGKELVAGVFETFRHWGVLIQSGVVGAITGMIPGIGGFTGNFMSYGIARQTSSKAKRDLYGTGIPDGIIAPEGSSLAKEAGHIIPILALGIPGGVAGALFIAALNIKDVHTGAGFQTAFPNVTGQIVWILALSGLIGTVAGVLLGPQIAKITKVPGPLIVPFIFAISISGPFLTGLQFFDVMELLVFGVIGLAMRRLRYPLGAFVIGLVLGQNFETNIYLTHVLYPGVSFLTQRPLADVIFFLSLVVLVSKWIELHREAKRTRALQAERLASATNDSERDDLYREQRRQVAPYPLLAPIVSAGLFGSSLYILIYGVLNYNFQSDAMPFVGGCCIAIPTALFLPRDVYRYIHHRKSQTPSGFVAAAAPSLLNVPTSLLSSATETATALESEEALSAGGGVSVEGPAPVRDRSWGRNGQYRREIIAYGWLFGLAAACWFIGFIWGVPAFVVCYGLIATRRYLPKLHQRLLFAFFGAVAMWLITYEMFHLTNIKFIPKINL